MKGVIHKWRGLQSKVTLGKTNWEVRRSEGFQGKLATMKNS